MKINTALILCAGLGKRLNPLTLGTPKPLLKLNNITILESCINTIIAESKRKRNVQDLVVVHAIPKYAAG